ncbi:MAG: M23 family metallopeptidase [Clostridia bacterium]
MNNFKRNGYINFKEKRFKFNLNKKYYILFISMSVLAIIGIYGNYTKFNKINNENYEVFNKNESISVMSNLNDINKLEFITPVKGIIINKFSNDKSNYSKTLEMFKIHDGIDIKAKINDKVVAVEKGKIEKVYKDSFYGNTVIIEHINGYKSIYSNVASSVKIKQIVKKNEVIGKIDNSAIGEIKEDIHLHFGLILNNIPIDPSNIIKF